MTPRAVILTGSVGGAKLVLGMMHLLPPHQITAIVNIGDDFGHLGMAISPDLDTLLYTLEGKANAAQGWGREGETLTFMDALRSLGGEDWFLLGVATWRCMSCVRTCWLAVSRSAQSCAGLPTRGTSGSHSWR